MGFSVAGKAGDEKLSLQPSLRKAWRKHLAEILGRGDN
jgi:hypothetical protein